MPPTAAASYMNTQDNPSQSLAIVRILTSRCQRCHPPLWLAASWTSIWTVLWTMTMSFRAKVAARFDGPPPSQPLRLSALCPLLTVGTIQILEEGKAFELGEWPHISSYHHPPSVIHHHAHSD